jgi:hypothetical protein
VKCKISRHSATITKHIAYIEEVRRAARSGPGPGDYVRVVQCTGCGTRSCCRPTGCGSKGSRSRRILRCLTWKCGYGAVNATRRGRRWCWLGGAMLPAQNDRARDVRPVKAFRYVAPEWGMHEKGARGRSVPGWGKCSLEPPGLSSRCRVRRSTLPSLSRVPLTGFARPCEQKETARAAGDGPSFSKGRCNEGSIPIAAQSIRPRQTGAQWLARFS